MELVDIGMCFVCGKKNPGGLQAEFEIDSDRRMLSGWFIPGEVHQGYGGIMHGGLAACLLDEAMVKLLWELGIPAVSASLEIRLKKPIRIGQKVVIKGWIESDRGRLFHTGARLESEEGTVLAEGTGVCVKISPKGDEK